jgi:hypothetical protein
MRTKLQRTALQCMYKLLKSLHTGVIRTNEHAAWATLVNKFQ